MANDPTVGDIQNVAGASFDPIYQRYLVVFSQGTASQEDVYAMFISDDGSSLSPGLVTIDNAAGPQFYPAIGVSPVSGRFLIGWHAQSNDVHCMLLNVDGSTFMGPFDLETEQHDMSNKANTCWQKTKVLGRIIHKLGIYTRIVGFEFCRTARI